MPVGEIANDVQGLHTAVEVFLLTCHPVCVCAEEDALEGCVGLGQEPLSGCVKLVGNDAGGFDFLVRYVYYVLVDLVEILVLEASSRDFLADFGFVLRRHDKARVVLHEKRIVENPGRVRMDVVRLLYEIRGIGRVARVSGGYLYAVPYVGGIQIFVNQRLYFFGACRGDKHGEDQYCISLHDQSSFWHLIALPPARTRLPAVSMIPLEE